MLMPDEPDPTVPDQNVLDQTEPDQTQTPPNANPPPPKPPTRTPGLDQLPPKGTSPADGLLARARATGLSRDILAWRDARG